MAQLTLTDLHPKEYIKGLRHYPFPVSLDICTESCNTFKNSSSRVCAPNTTKCKFKSF